MKTLSLSVFLCLLFFSCSIDKEKKEEVFSKPLILITINIDSLFQNKFRSLTNSKELRHKNWVEKVYKNLDYKTIWINNELKTSSLGDSVLRILQHANYYGLEAKDYKSEELQNLKKELFQTKSKEDRLQHAINLEVLLTDNILLFAKHLHIGKIENTDSLSILERKPLTIDLPLSFAQAEKKDSIFNFLEKIQPQQREYQNLRLALQKFVEKSALSKEKVLVKNFREDSVKAYQQAEKALILHQYISEKKSESELLVALKEFQIDHGLTPDGIVGENTAESLSKSPYEYYQNAAISLERWRWKPEWESSYLYVNIPEYRLTYYKNDTLQLASNVVVGGNYNRTPEIYSKLSYLVAYPFWNVPQSISVREIMVKAKKDSNYMHKNNYEVFTKKLKEIPLEEMEWDTLNAKNFNFYVRQKGGSSNALGFVKFIFHNDFSIYFHDTPTKYHFNRDIRNYSHGCIRVEKAMQLADTLLKSDRNLYNLDSVKSYIEKQKEKKMMFTQKLPIYLQYITCAVNQNNRLIFYKDIYGLDDKIRKVLFK